MFKQIEDYPDYDIYDDGRVYSRKSNKFLKPCKNNSGYDTLNLYKGDSASRKTCLLHVLVATYFVPNPNGYKEVNHIDGDKNNNDYRNLEWCTHSDNLHHCYDNNRHSKQKSVLCLENGKVYSSMTKAAEDLHCSGGMISAVCRGKRRRHANMHFEYH